MQQLETLYSTFVRKILNDCSIDTIKMHGNQYQRDIADLLVISRLTRKQIWLETKANSGRPTPTQRRFLSRVDNGYWCQIFKLGPSEYTFNLYFVNDKGDDELQLEKHAPLELFIKWVIVRVGHTTA